ncbi:MAG: DUF4139 domain-containing protein [Tannerellaceae bacterium]|jgi:uncharacterized protein (TIGR02231 family)|nr:DUF4139 domain-containing protein [Tannerellaceae bacterium]
MNRKKLYLLMTCALCLMPAEAQQKERIVNGALKEVVMFFEGAEMTHSASAALSKGENEIWIEGLSPKVDRNSLKIKMTGGAIISAYEFSPNYLADKPLSPTAQRLQDSIDLCRKSLQKVQTEAKINEQLIALLNSGTTKNVSGSDKGMPFDDLVKTMDYYKSKSTELITTASTLKEKEAELTQLIQRLTAQLNQESLKNRKESGLLKIRLEAPQPANSVITVSYYTSAAGWTPYYDLNIEAADRPVKLIFKARLQQISGIDWEKVRLTLSSAQPSRGRTAPSLSTWFLNFAEELVMGYGKRREAVQYEALEEVVITTPIRSADAAPPVTPTLDYYVKAADNDLNLSFAIDLPYSIPGNGKEQSVDLTTQELNATYRYYSIPKMDAATYLMADILNPEKLNLLSGKASITYEGSYVGEILINISSTEPSLSLALGTDNRVAVKREKVQAFSSRKLLGSEIEQVFTYRITVRNGRNSDIKMVVKDQYPVSGDNAIKVELLKETTKPTLSHENGIALAERGILVWEDSLKAAETKTYTVSYSIRYPRNKSLNL